MPVIGRLHGRALNGNQIESIPSDAFTALVDLKELYVPPFTLPAAFLLSSRMHHDTCICVAKAVL